MLIGQRLKTVANPFCLFYHLYRVNSDICREMLLRGLFSFTWSFRLVTSSPLPFFSFFPSLFFSSFFPACAASPFQHGHHLSSNSFRVLPYSSFLLAGVVCYLPTALSIGWCNHVSTTLKVDSVFADAILDDAARITSKAHFDDDVSCCLEWRNAGTSGPFGTSGDGKEKERTHGRRANKKRVVVEPA